MSLIYHTNLMPARRQAMYYACAEAVCYATPMAVLMEGTRSLEGSCAELLWTPLLGKGAATNWNKEDTF